MPLEDMETESTETENQGEVTESDDTQVQEGEETETETEDKEIEPSEKKLVSQEDIQKRIDKLTYKRYEEKEKRIEAEKKLAEKEAELKKLKKQSEEIEIPPVPDPLEPGYEEKLQRREEALTKRAQLEAQRQLAESQRAEQQQKRINDNVERMYKSAAKLGFSPEEFKKAENNVSMFIKTPEVAGYILDNENSSLIVQYLSGNIEVLEELGNMDPLKAAVFITNDIIPKAKKLKPVTTKTPEPLDVPKGKGGGEGESPYLRDVEFE
jgi:hypothetical protein